MRYGDGVKRVGASPKSALPCRSSRVNSYNKEIKLNTNAISALSALIAELSCRTARLNCVARDFCVVLLPHELAFWRQLAALWIDDGHVQELRF